MAFTHDGRHVAAGGADLAARIYEVSTGREVSRFDGGTEVTALAFSGDDAYLETFSGSTLDRRAWRSTDMVRQACSRLTRNLTPTEWAQYLGGNRIERPAQGLSSVRRRQRGRGGRGME